MRKNFSDTLNTYFSTDHIKREHAALTAAIGLMGGTAIYHTTNTTQPPNKAEVITNWEITTGQNPTRQNMTGCDLSEKLNIRILLNRKKWLKRPAKGIHKHNNRLPISIVYRVYYPRKTNAFRPSSDLLTEYYSTAAAALHRVLELTNGTELKRLDQELAHDE